MVLLGINRVFEANAQAWCLLTASAQIFRYSEFLARKIKIIQIDTQTEDWDARGKVDYGYWGDIKMQPSMNFCLATEEVQYSFLDKMRSNASRRLKEKYEIPTCQGKRKRENTIHEDPE